MLDRVVTVEQAARAVGVPAEWLLTQIQATRLPSGADGVTLGEAFDAVKNYHRDERAEHRRMARLRFER